MNPLLRTFFATAALFLLSCASGCGPVDPECADAECAWRPDGGSPVPDAGPVGITSIDAYCERWLPAVCARWVACGQMETQAGCEDVFRNRWGITCPQESVAGVRDGRVRIDGVRAEACLDAIPTHTCFGEEGAREQEDCALVFLGEVPLGQSCYADVDCEGSAWCDSSALVCPSVCAPRKAVGESALADRECEEGLYVYAGKCRAFVATSGSCAPDGAAEKQRCNSWDFCNDAQTCEARRRVNQPCAGLGQCDAWLTCSKGTCLAPLDSTEPCDENVCKSDLHCDFAANGGSGTCKSPEAEGAPCWQTNDCVAMAYCRGGGGSGSTDGTCVARGQGGESCSATAPCAPGLACVGGSCATPRDLGEPCASAGECATSLNCSGDKCQRSYCADLTP